MAKHLNYEQRIQLETLYKLGKTRAEMAAFLNCSIRTVFYELQKGYYEHRNGDTWKMERRYSADIAQKKYEYELSQKGCQIKLGKSWTFVELIEELIGKQRFSPRAALGYIQANNIDVGITVSPATLYDWIDKGYFLHIGNKNLPEGKRTNKPKTRTRRAPSSSHALDKSITDRPKHIETRQEAGHWEMDTVQGKREGKQNCLLVLTERKTKQEIVLKMKSKTAAETIRALDKLERKLGSRTFKTVFKTITCDNGAEFADAKGIEKRNRTEAYFCHPYCSWERGQNENANKLIRRFIPKGTSINPYTHKQIKYIQHWMNNYPRAMLNWKTPAQLFAQEFPNVVL